MTQGPSSIRMTRLILRTAFALLLWVMVAPSRDARCAEDVDGLILSGIDALYDLDFREAEERFERIVSGDPHAPAGHFYLAMVSWSRLVFGFWSPEDVDEFKKRIDHAIRVAEERTESSDPHPYNFFYLGGALGFKGRFELMRRRWLPAFFLASNAIDALKRSRGMIPHNEDVSFGLGIYDYYTFRLSGVLKFLSYLLLHRGSKEEGLRKLHRAVDYAPYSSTEAMSMLLHIYLFLEAEPARALPLADRLSKKYPRNPRYPLLKGVAQIWLGMEDGYRDTLESLRQVGLDTSPQRRAALWHRRALYLETIHDLYFGRCLEARSRLNSILRWPDRTNDPAMIAWPLIKIGMSYDLQGNRHKALTYYREVLTMRNGSGAQFLAEKLIDTPPVERDPFLGY